MLVLRFPSWVRRRIRLRENCLECHGGEQVKGEFDLSNRQELMKSASVDLAHPGGSGLLKLIRHQEDPVMPKRKPIGTNGLSDKASFRADNANPEYRRLYIERAKRLVDFGVSSFQRDDPDEGFFDWGKKGRRDAIPAVELLEFHRWARTEPLEAVPNLR